MDYIAFPVRPDVKAHLVINCVIGFVVFIVVSARLIARKFMGTGLGLDDYFIVCALVSSPYHRETQSRPTKVLLAAMLCPHRDPRNM